MLALVMVVVVAIPAALRGDGTVTLLMRSGEKVSGELASYDQSTIDLRDGGGARRSFQMREVVLIDFVGEASGMPNGELIAAQQAGGDHLLVPRRGPQLRGRIGDFVGEGGPDARVLFDTGNGRRDVKVDTVARIYVGAFTDQAYTAAGVARPPTGDSGSPVVTPGELTLPATTKWLDTGVRVRRGEQIGISASGRITLRGGDVEAGPAGALDGSRDGGAPLPGLPAGALIGRIDNGAPFGIGDQPSIAAPASGRLMVGVNDGNTADNRGEFKVRITPGRDR
jgi:hypothetical protein